MHAQKEEAMRFHACGMTVVRLCMPVPLCCIDLMGHQLCLPGFQERNSLQAQTCCWHASQAQHLHRVSVRYFYQASAHNTASEIDKFKHVPCTGHCVNYSGQSAIALRSHSACTHLKACSASIWPLGGMEIAQQSSTIPSDADAANLLGAITILLFS